MTVLFAMAYKQTQNYLDSSWVSGEDAQQQHIYTILHFQK